MSFQTIRPVKGSAAAGICVRNGIPFPFAFTYSCPVIDALGNLKLLIAWHSFGEAFNKLLPEYEVCQPPLGQSIAQIDNNKAAMAVGLVDSAFNAQQKIASGKGFESQFLNTTDAVLATPKFGIPISREILGIGVISGWKEPQKGMVVKWNGAVSGFSKGIIIETQTPFPFPIVDPESFFALAGRDLRSQAVLALLNVKIFSEQFVVQITEGRGQGGDTGASVIEDGTNAIVGLVLAGVAPQSNILFCQRFSNLVRKLGINPVIPVGMTQDLSITPSSIPMIQPSSLVSRTYWYFPTERQKGVTWFGR